MSNTRLHLLMTLIYCIYYPRSIQCLEKELTVIVDPSKENCFYQPLKGLKSVQFEYQVISGGHGDLDISFYVVDPTGRILLSDFKKSENSHDFDSERDGDFKFCFDNTFSSFSSKVVFFELIVDDSTEDQNSSEDNFNFATGTVDQMDNVKLEYIYEAANIIKGHLNKVRLLQDFIKSTEAKDRNVAEETNFQVTFYSVIILFIMIFVSFIQLVMVKSLFDDKSKIHQIWSYFDIQKRFISNTFGFLNVGSRYLMEIHNDMRIKQLIVLKISTIIFCTMTYVSATQCLLQMDLNPSEEGTVSPKHMSWYKI